MVLAGCMDLTDEDVESIVDSIVELPGCNDETAYNYDENATNNLACLTEQVLKQSVTDFINLVDNGPAWGETMGMMMEGSETDSDGMTTTFTNTMAVSPDGMYFMTEMDMGMMVIEIGELMTENADGTTNIQSTWMGNTFQMNTEAMFADHWNEQSFNEDDDDSNDDDMDMSDGDMDLGLPDTDVEIPDDFDPATALYTAGLSTSNGYSFTTVVEHDADYSTTMTFTLSSDLAVTSLVMVENYDGMTSTSSITILDAEAAGQLLVNDETLVEHALPFTLSPIGGDDDHDDSDDVDWSPYHGGYCEWEGNPDDEQDVWSCKYDASDSDWDTWWYYCELHGEDWYCTDDYGQDSEYENSAGNTNYNHDGHDHGDHDDHDGDHDDHDGDHDDHDDDGGMSIEDIMMAIDDDGDNLITWTEFEDFIINEDGGWGDEPDRSDTYDAFNASDMDDDGYLNAEEFEAMLYAMNTDEDDDHDGDHDDHDGDHDDHDGDHDDHDDDIMMSEADAWALIDADGDGYATVSEIVNGLNSMGAPTPEEAMEDSDTDNSGGVSWDEFVAEWNSEEDEDSDEHLDNNAQLASDLHAAFNSSDVDNDGNLSIDELGSFIDQVVSLTNDGEDTTEMTEIIQQFVSCVDTDDDGLLDEMEFSEFYMLLEEQSMEMVFCMFDTDGDGLISASEYSSNMNDSDDGSEPMTEENWQAIVALVDMYDLDENGGLDMSEFDSLMMDMDDDDDDHDDHDGHDHGDHDGHDHDDHMMAYDWMIDTADMMTETEAIGAFADYHIVLANCVTESSDDMMGGETLSCGDDVLKVTIAEATAPGSDIMFHDADSTGTITAGDMVHINPDIDAGGEWNTVRLYSVDADKYSDENPMMTPGFTAFAGIVALLGAALLTRRD